MPAAAAGDDSNIISGCKECGCTSSLFKFHDQLKDRGFVIAFLQNHGLIAKEKECPRCAGECYLDPVNLNWRCQKKRSINKKRPQKCNTRLNALAGTFFLCKIKCRNDSQILPYFYGQVLFH